MSNKNNLLNFKKRYKKTIKSSREKNKKLKEKNLLKRIPIEKKMKNKGAKNLIKTNEFFYLF